MSAIASYEYGVEHQRVPGEPHRSGMSEDAAREWIEEAEEDGCTPGTFRLIRRSVGTWESAS